MDAMGEGDMDDAEKVKALAEAVREVVPDLEGDLPVLNKAADALDRYAARLRAPAPDVREAQGEREVG